MLHPPISYDGELYLYLEKEEFARTWTQGGQIPLFGAKKYLGERAGTMTPDEVRQRRAIGTSFQEAAELGVIIGENVVNSSVSGTFYRSRILVPTTSGAQRPKKVLGIYDHFFEDARLLCLACSLDKGLMVRLGKTAALRVVDRRRLKGLLDGAVGSESTCGRVAYTSGEGRGHFLKGEEDQWQDEFRFVWPGDAATPKWIEIPGGLMEQVRTH